MKCGKETIVRFKAKPTTSTVWGTPFDDPTSWRIVHDRALKIPRLTRGHIKQCSLRLWGLINTNCAGDFATRELHQKYGRTYTHIDMDKLPPGVLVEDTGFLKTVTITI